MEIATNIKGIIYKGDVSIKTLFEIPIYGVSERDFIQRNELRIRKSYVRQDGVEVSDETKEQLRNLLVSDGSAMWKFNQRIGYIEMVLRGNTLDFNVYYPDLTNYVTFSKKRRFMKYQPINNSHIDLNCSDNEQIYTKIYEKLYEIQKHIPSRFFVDYSIFNNVIRYTDIYRMLNKDEKAKSKKASMKEMIQTLIQQNQELGLYKPNQDLSDLE